ncbi:DUF547 domain-containing protein [Hyphomonas johnsonii]|uniref:DUF547 domain-containing protein n=1 Tax=Hyphomonas johnsonii MHS-2 TaxID=1280950 RepID=A0A059FNS1_9PROT|nr:DUF547 domain-containing protein [Hyphomonas johnsonii]KCZ92093.1 hypothetical protein HJO_08664 [Hyphomonas johnsonii MHS-2]
MKRTAFALALALAAITLAPVAGAEDAGAQTVEGTQMAKAQHADWTRLLGRYVHASPDGVNLFDYAGLKASAADREALDTYIARFADMDLSGTNNAAFAAWANLYNAVTVRYIVSKYPLGSIKDGYFFGGPWKKVKVVAGGREVSLDDIEHKILRPTFHDPRVHYSINCASISCPNLMAKAWEPATLDADLDGAARAYVNNPRGVTVTDKGLVLSSIYDWFQDDFGGSKDAVIAHLLAYADTDLAARIRANPKINSFAYDWSLNDTE